MVDESGLVANYRKLHLFSADTTWATVGDQLPPTFEVAGVSATVAICADIEFPESFILPSADKRPAVICLPTAWVDEPAPASQWWLRAKEMNCYVVAADLSGVEKDVRYSGGSCVISDTGTVVDIVSECEGLALAAIEPRSTQIKVSHQDLSPKLFLAPYEFTSNILRGRIPSPISPPGYRAIGCFSFPTNMEWQGTTPIESISSVTLAHIDQDSSDRSTAPELLVIAIGPLPSIDQKGQSGIELEFQKEAEKLINSSTYSDVVIVFPAPNQTDQRPQYVHAGRNATRFTKEGTIELLEPYLKIKVITVDELCTWEPARLFALEGGHMIVAIGKESPDFSSQPRPAHLCDPYCSDGYPHDLSVGRVRAGENNLIVLVATSLATNEVSSQSGVFGPDHTRVPLQEHSLYMSNEVLAFHRYILDPGSNDLVCLSEKPYLRRRKPTVYATAFGPKSYYRYGPRQ